MESSWWEKPSRSMARRPILPNPFPAEPVDATRVVAWWRSAVPTLMTTKPTSRPEMDQPSPSQLAGRCSLAARRFGSRTAPGTRRRGRLDLAILRAPGRRCRRPSPGADEGANVDGEQTGRLDRGWRERGVVRIRGTVRSRLRIVTLALMMLGVASVTVTALAAAQQRSASSEGAGAGAAPWGWVCWAWRCWLRWRPCCSRRPSAGRGSSRSIPPGPSCWAPGSRWPDGRHRR